MSDYSFTGKYPHLDPIDSLQGSNQWATYITYDIDGHPVLKYRKMGMETVIPFWMDRFSSNWFE